MRTYSLMLFIVCLNVASYILLKSGTASGSPLPFNPEATQKLFSLGVFTLDWQSLGLIGTGAGVIGLIGLLTRQYVYASAAILIWALGIIIEPIKWIFVGTPDLLRILLPSEVSVFLAPVITALFSMIFFMFMLEIVTQRSIT